ncbi:GAF domain-containing protein [candidate division KSB1 bacterium]|nr:GAF domain-containing protein [candidate division KSB1 bacterium]
MPHMTKEMIRLICFNDLLDSKLDASLSQFKDKYIKVQVTCLEELLDELRLDYPAILLIHSSVLKNSIKQIEEKITSIDPGYLAIIQIGDDVYVEMSHVNFYDIVSLPITRVKLAVSIGHAFSYYAMDQEIVRVHLKLNTQVKELYELNKIGIALSAEQDTDKLLELILQKSREITHADAGSLYLVEKIPAEKSDKSNYFADKQLRFKLMQNDSVTIGVGEFLMPIEKRSIAGYVAITDQVLNLHDVYELPADCDFVHNRVFDDAVGYRAKSMLVIPMKTHKDEIIGVLQLINRKKHWNTIINSPGKIEEEIIPFDVKCVSLASSLASQAAVSIENNRLYAEIKKSFEGFIKAAMHAIEQRDPTTFGHSERVAVLTTALAKVVNKTTSGPLKDVRFTNDQIHELNYAALLHDFGKIGVRENVLVKAKKLYPHELEYINYRFRLFKKYNHLNLSHEKIDLLLNKKREVVLEKIRKLDHQLQDWDNLVKEYWNTVIEANEPDLIMKEGVKKISTIGKLVYHDNGHEEQVLTAHEIERLSIPKGSLSVEERAEIKLHVIHSYNFLNKIPWTSEFKNIPEIVYAHHERLDGTGYPRGLMANEIPIQSKMIAITDTYDALTAWDRPYKKAVPFEKALEIIDWEVNAGHLDAELFRIFVEARLFDLVSKDTEQLE